MSYALVLIEDKREGMKLPSHSVTHTSSVVSMMKDNGTLLTGSWPQNSLETHALGNILQMRTNSSIPYDSAIPLWSIHPKKTKL